MSTWKVVEKNNPPAVHAHCSSPEGAARWIAELAPLYCARGLFTNKSLTPDSFTVQPPRYQNVSCSQCGGKFGPGDAGYSHCKDHQARSQ